MVKSELELTDPLPQLGSCCRCHPPSSAYRDVPRVNLSLLSRNEFFEISPLEMGLQIPDGALVSASEFVDLLRLEIALLKPKIHKRPVNLLTIQDSTGLCSNTEFTTLMYVLGKNFNLSHNNTKVYTFETSPHQITEHRLALLTGLGFNRISILLSPDMDTFDLPLPLDPEKKIRGFGFPGLTVKLYYGDHNSTIAWQQLVNYLLALRPEKIVAQRLQDTQSPANPLQPVKRDRSEIVHESEQFLLVYSALKENGYRIIGNDCFVRETHPLFRAQTTGKLRRTINGYNASHVSDCLNIGPGAQGQLGEFYYSNMTDLERYSLAVKRRQPPFWRGLTLDNDGLACKRVIDDLSCFHRTRFSSAMHFFKVDLKQIFDKLDKRYQNHPGYPFWVTTEDSLTLTETGILYLRMICNAMGGELTSQSTGSRHD